MSQPPATIEIDRRRISVITVFRDLPRSPLIVAQGRLRGWSEELPVQVRGKQRLRSRGCKPPPLFLILHRLASFFPFSDETFSRLATAVRASRLRPSRNRYRAILSRSRVDRIDSASGASIPKLFASSRRSRSRREERTASAVVKR